MIVLGINSSHNSTACLLKDGKIIACISEERLTGVKNQTGLPILSIKKMMKDNGLQPEDIDRVAFSFKDMMINTGFSALNESSSSLPTIWHIKEWLLYRIPETRHIYPFIQNAYYKFFLFKKLKQDLLIKFEKETKIDKNKIEFVDHHSAHAHSAYFASPKYSEGKRLILTLDAMGDGLCASVSKGAAGKIALVAQTSFGNSIGDLYAHITRYLGMKMGEHEYKVMGLAPYAENKNVERIYQRIKDWLWVNRDLTFGSRVFSHVFYKLLDSPFKNERFDSIAGAIQKLTEELLVEWVEKAIKRTRISDVVCGGGVFMNVKANQKILEIKSLTSLFVMPSCGDESTAFGAAYYAYQRQRKKDLSLPEIEPLGDLYLGPKYSDEEILRELRKSKNRKYKFERYRNIEKKTASLLSQRKIVARFSGRMEWGARALGNRSILSHPQNLEGVRDINEQIKNRDFWMPFAPSILSENINKYIVNPKKTRAQYMILTFESTAKGKKELRAALHQSDYSTRPQEVIQEYNPAYYKLVLEFKKTTGIGAVLNTSFNLHGYPIVCSPKDALYVFENSGLEYLVLEQFLVSKI